jgi:hypothetical protein
MIAFRTTVAAAVTFCAAGAALSADLGTRTAIATPVLPVETRLASDFFEVRGGLMKHQLVGPKHDEEASWNINGEVVLPSLFKATGTSFQDVLFAPRFHVGGMVNVEGLTSYGYAGLTWTFDLTPRWFFETSFGAGYSDGKTDRIFRDRIDVGCRLGFHETFSLGYRLTDNWSVMGTFAHVSNAGICPPNDGINEVGVRAAYRF